MKCDPVSDFVFRGRQSWPGDKRSDLEMTDQRKTSIKEHPPNKRPRLKMTDRTWPTEKWQNYVKGPNSQ